MWHRTLRAEQARHHRDMARRIHCKRNRRAELSPHDLSEQTARPDTRRGRSQGIDGLEAGGADGPHRVTRLAAHATSVTGAKYVIDGTVPTAQPDLAI